ncbi:TPA: tyrosine-type recombinase/integrase [Vibrio parahaemolyticus]|nr:tyrosine-type recombinase/integrase [Vibrio parahaemolyticus]
MNKQTPKGIHLLSYGYAHEDPTGDSEWVIIQTLQAQYHGQLVKKTFNEKYQRECVFQEDTWDYSKEHKDWLKASFSNIFPSDHSATALELAVRIIGYHLSRGHSKKEYSAKTIAGTLGDSKQAINWLIEKNILVGSPGDYLIPSSRLKSADFNLFFDEIGHYSLTGFLGKTRLLSIWHEMSKANRLPSFMSLPLDPFQGNSAKSAWDTRSHLRKKKDEDEGSWDPIPLNYAFQIVNEALKLIEDQHQDVLDAYELLRLAQEIHSDRHTGLKMLLSDRPEMKEKLPPRCLVDGRLTIKPIIDLITEAQASAIIIVLSTTGLRNWEMRNLKVGCCKPDQTIRGTFRLEACIKKTSKERSNGKIVALPIPKTTASAIEILEAMRFHGGEYLIESPVRAKGKRPSTHFVDTRVKRFCTEKNIGYIPHPHQFRKTIAGWFGIHSKYATLLVMRLFSHESAAMANRYLFNNPLIKEERVKTLMEAFQSLIGPLKEALIDGKLKGPMGEQLNNAIANHAYFEGLTGDELVQSLEKLLRERVESGQTYLLLTPLAVCTTNTHSNDLPPCAAITCSKGTCTIDDQIGRFNQTVPNPEKCQGAGCNRAIITTLTKDGVTRNLEFYQSLLFDSKAEFAENILLMDRARTFVKNHEELVKYL